jgi:hypothetical protein
MILQKASSNTSLRTIVDDNKSGRFMKFYATLFMFKTTFGSILAGEMAKVMGVSNTISIGGKSCVLDTLIFAHKLIELNKMIHSVLRDLRFKNVVPTAS